MPMSVESIAENSWLKLVGRGVMALSIPMFMWVMGYLSGLSASVTSLQQDVSLNKLKIESHNISINELKGALTTLDNRTILILQSVARLEATAK
jgi:hypothetical protein